MTETQNGHRHEHTFVNSGDVLLQIPQVNSSHIVSGGAVAADCSAVFFKLVSTQFGNKVDDSLFAGVIYGIVDEVPSSASTSPCSLVEPGRPLLNDERLPPGMLRLRPSQLTSFTSRGPLEEDGK